MKLKPNKHTIFFIIVSIVMVAIIGFGTNGNAQFVHNRVEGVSFLPARVIEVVDDRTSFNEAGARVGSQTLRVQLLSGARRGDIIEARNMLFPIERAVFAQAGTRVIVYFEHLPGSAVHEYAAHVQSYDRSIAIYTVVLGFFGLLGLVFGKTGLRSAFGLIFTFVIIMFLLLPLVTNGGPPALLTITLSFVIIAVSLIAIMGFEKKTYVSIAGASIGILLYIIFYFIIGAALRITGFNVPEVDMLIIAGFQVGVNQLLFSTILIASLGALMDVSVSLSSVIAELSATNQNAGFQELFRSGMKIGRDIIGSSSNTLILAFMGAFFISLILFRVNHVHYNLLINHVDIGIEVLRAVSASVAMVLCAPATALIGSQAFAAKSNRKKRIAFNAFKYNPKSKRGQS